MSITINDINYVLDNNTHTASVVGATITLTNIIIPSTITNNSIQYNVTNIANNAFINYTNIISVLLPNSINNIGSNAFDSCINLKTINIPISISEIPMYCFNNCINLTSCIIENNSILTKINNYAFYNCTSLLSLKIPNTVSSIGSNCFDTCTKLITINIPDLVTLIPTQCFNNCISLLTCTISITSQLTEIDYKAFNNCTSLTSIYIPQNVSNIINNPFILCPLTSITVHSSNTYFMTDVVGNGVVLRTINNAINGRIIKATNNINGFYNITNIITIKNYAFYDCSNLTGVSIPITINNIGDHSFLKCGLQTIISASANYTVDVSNNGYIMYGNSKLLVATINLTGTYTVRDNQFIHTIMDYAFYNCSNLTGIILPSYITTFTALSFLGCNLQTITCNNTYDFYTHNSNNSNIIYNNSGVVMSTVNLTGLYTVLTQNPTTSTDIININKYAFVNNNNLVSIILPNTITTFSDHAFMNCTSLNSILFNKLPTVPPDSTDFINTPFITSPSISTIYYYYTDRLNWIPAPSWIPNGVSLVAYNPVLLNGSTIISYNNSYDSNNTSQSFPFTGTYESDLTKKSISIDIYSNAPSPDTLYVDHIDDPSLSIPLYTDQYIITSTVLQIITRIKSRFVRIRINGTGTYKRIYDVRLTENINKEIQKNMFILSAGLSTSSGQTFPVNNYCDLSNTNANNITIYGKSTANTQTLLTVQFSPDKITWYNSQYVYNFNNGGDFGFNFQTSTAYIRLKLDMPNQNQQYTTNFYAYLAYS